jgi:hypothetical protein
MELSLVPEFWRELIYQKLCITAEKWFVSGESNVFRLSRDDVNGIS